MVFNPRMPVGPGNKTKNVSAECICGESFRKKYICYKNVQKKNNIYMYIYVCVF